MKELANKKKLGTKTWFFAVVYPFRAHFLKKFGVFAHVGNFVHYFFFCSKIGEMAEIIFLFFLNKKRQMDYPFFSFCSKSGDG